MKYFTEPNGKFIIKIPFEWQYKNKIEGYEEVSPYSFAPYDKSYGAFQISCYSSSEKKINPSIEVQKADTDNLRFITARMDGDGFNVHLWYCIVEDFIFMAKYIYDTTEERSRKIKNELRKAEKALQTLQLVSLEKREYALELDKYDKFMGALTASFDIKNKAFKKNSFIEFIIIVASQIDAYLRLSIIMALQLNNKTDTIEIKYISQLQTDKPVMEKKIYELAKELGIINEQIHTQLYSLYNRRNMVVHRFIISEITTMEIYDLAYEYEIICESVRLCLKAIEEKQESKKIGIYKNGLPDNGDLSKDDMKFIFSKVNDKHSLSRMYRKI